MLNKIWFALLCIGILYGFSKSTYQTITTPAAFDVDVSESAIQSAASGQLDLAFVRTETAVVAMGKQLNAATLDAAELSVTICIGLIGIMALWLGLLNVARQAGLVDAFARLLRPLMRWLFPGIPNGHPAQGAILMNLSANMLGLDNAATPMGLKAMTELQTLNPVKDTATNSMAMFLAINNSSVTLIPITIIGVRALTGSRDPMEPLVGTLIVTTINTVSAVLITRWLSNRPAYRAAAEGVQPDVEASLAKVEDSNG